MKSFMKHFVASLLSCSSVAYLHISHVFKSQGCNAVSWAPAMYSTSLVHNDGPLIRKRMASGGNDNFVKIWRFVRFYYC